MDTTSPTPNDLPELRQSAHDFVGYRYDPGYSMSPHDPSTLTMRASMQDYGSPQTLPITHLSGKNIGSTKDTNFTDKTLAALSVMHGQIKDVDRKLTQLLHQLGLYDDISATKTDEEKAEQHRRIPDAPYSDYQGNIDLAPVVVVLCGLPGSGKTSFCYELDPTKVHDTTRHNDIV
jgi:hypothetical protein